MHESTETCTHTRAHTNTRTQTHTEFLLNYSFLFFLYTTIIFVFLYYGMPCYKQLISELSIRSWAVDRHSLRVSLPADATPPPPPPPQEYRGAIRRGPQHMSTCSERQGQRHQHQQRGGGVEGVSSFMKSFQGPTDHYEAIFGKIIRRKAGIKLNSRQNVHPLCTRGRGRVWISYLCQATEGNLLWRDPNE